MTKEERKQYNQWYYNAKKDKWKEYSRKKEGNFVYYFKVGRKVLYVGNTTNLNRFNHHFCCNHELLEEILDKDYKIYVADLGDLNDFERYYIEKCLIKELNPLLNVLQKNNDYSISNRSIKSERKNELKEITKKLTWEIWE